MFQICITFFLLQILSVKEDILKNVSAVFVHIIKNMPKTTFGTNLDKIIETQKRKSYSFKRHEGK